MSALDGLISGSAGPSLAIASMTVATYLCRCSGAVLMSHVRLTPRVERALRALPGSIVVATALPICVQSGPAALAGLVAAVVVMALSRLEIAAMLAGLAAVALVRSAGF